MCYFFSIFVAYWSFIHISEGLAKRDSAACGTKAPA